MKKIVLLSLVVVFASLMIGCDIFGHSNETPFEGKWQNFYAPVDLIYEFKGDTWELTIDTMVYKGAFQFDDSHITFIFRDGLFKDTWTQEYSFGDNTLNIQQDPERLSAFYSYFGHMHGPFKRL
jgi:hypothetical protein